MIGQILQTLKSEHNPKGHTAVPYQTEIVQSQTAIQKQQLLSFCNRKNQTIKLITQTGEKE